MVRPRHWGTGGVQGRDMILSFSDDEEDIYNPSSKPRDYMTKLFKYRTAGVREYWIVDPDKQMTMVYGFEKDTVEQYDFGEDVLVGIYDDFTIKIE